MRLVALIEASAFCGFSQLYCFLLDGIYAMRAETEIYPSMLVRYTGRSLCFSSSNLLRFVLNVRAVRLNTHLLDAAVPLHPRRLVATGIARIPDAQPVRG